MAEWNGLCGDEQDIITIQHVDSADDALKARQNLLKTISNACQLQQPSKGCPALISQHYMLWCHLVFVVCLNFSRCLFNLNECIDTSFLTWVVYCNRGQSCVMLTKVFQWPPEMSPAVVSNSIAMTYIGLNNALIALWHSVSVQGCCAGSVRLSRCQSTFGLVQTSLLSKHEHSNFHKLPSATADWKGKAAKSSTEQHLASAIHWQ